MSLWETLCVASQSKLKKVALGSHSKCALLVCQIDCQAYIGQLHR